MYIPGVLTVEITIDGAVSRFAKAWRTINKNESLWLLYSLTLVFLALDNEKLPMLSRSLQKPSMFLFSLLPTFLKLN